MYNNGPQILDKGEKNTHFLTSLKGIAGPRKIILGKGWSDGSEE